MFEISFSPVRAEGHLSVAVEGETIILNGTAYDLGPLAEGDVLPPFAPEVQGPVTRRAGLIRVNLFLPHGPDAPEAVRFPASVQDPAAAPGLVPWTGAVQAGAVDWAGRTTAASRAAADLDAARRAAQTRLLRRLDAVAQVITGEVPLVEKLSWGPKEAAARAWLAATAEPDARALIEGEAMVTGEDPAELAARIVAKAQAYRAAVAAMTGLRRRAETALAAATAPAEAEAILADVETRIAALMG